MLNVAFDEEEEEEEKEELRKRKKYIDINVPLIVILSLVIVVTLENKTLSEYTNQFAMTNTQEVAKFIDIINANKRQTQRKNEKLYRMPE